MSCSKYPHVLSCGLKLRAQEDERLKQWTEDEKFISSIRDWLSEDRKPREMQGDIRIENRRHLEEPNPQSPFNQTVLQDDGSIEFFPDNVSSPLLVTSRAQYPTDVDPPVYNIPNSQAEFPIQQPQAQGFYSGEALVLPGTSEFSNMRFLNGPWTQFHPSYPVDDNVPFAAQFQVSNSFGSYGSQFGALETHEWDQSFY